MKGEWRIKFGSKKPRLESATQCWKAVGASSMDLEIAYTGQATTARVFWKRLDDDQYDTKKSLALDLNPDGKSHTYHLDLGSSSEYRNLITGLSIEPVAQPRPGEEMAVKSIVFSGARR
jgi:hypothetical protein